ncbi:MAG: SHOCT domain-containing protein [Campylobacterota bacterium]|nr:SHOCT domain-containing protein [Campylobacterota bacterium]
MKKIILLLNIAFLSIILTACADRTPFKEQKPLKNTALVYVYNAKTVSTDENTYENIFTIKIDNKIATAKLFESEYVAYDLKPRTVTISVLKAAIEVKNITLDLEAGESYYLRIKGSESVEFENINEAQALKEIAKTGVAGSNYIFGAEDKVEGLVDTTSDNKKPRSEADEIQRLYDMKEKGIITQEEFQTLKAKVIN